MPNLRKFLSRTDFVGGDLETQEDGFIYRGPIKRIWVEDGKLIIVSSWSARMPKDMSSGWSVYENHNLIKSIGTFQPVVIGEGRVQFVLPLLGFAVIFPKGGSKLDPAKVDGLEV